DVLFGGVETGGREPQSLLGFLNVVGDGTEGGRTVAAGQAGQCRRCCRNSSRDAAEFSAKPNDGIRSALLDLSKLVKGRCFAVEGRIRVGAQLDDLSV